MDVIFALIYIKNKHILRVFTRSQRVLGAEFSF